MPEHQKSSKRVTHRGRGSTAVTSQLAGPVEGSGKIFCYVDYGIGGYWRAVRGFCSLDLYSCSRNQENKHFIKCLESLSANLARHDPLPSH
jgi:hypothetical protein